MQLTQSRKVGTLRAVEAFLDDNAAALVGIADTGARKTLAADMTTINGHAVDQGGNVISAQSATLKTGALRKVLIRNYMAPIARIARAQLPHTQELLPLRMPRGNPTTEQAAFAARGMAQAATPYSSIFITAGLSTDFIAQLNTATDAMLATVDQRKLSQGKSTGATTGLGVSLRSAFQSVSILDSFVRNALIDQPALLANWNRIRKVAQTASRSTTTPAVTPPVAPAAPAAAPSVPQPTEEPKTA
jgi:hypothetical protein